jgi:2',3'-cyclic-nucleotide 2'-phosphodiesterase (5'-nucleotidase family)
VVGLDTHDTPATTNANNILEFCFADEADAFLSTRAQIEAMSRQGSFPPPDLYFITTHNGDTATGDSLFLVPLLTRLGDKVNGVIAGHTHQSNHQQNGFTHAIQSGANGQHFGRIDLIYNTVSRKVIASQSANFIEFSEHGCDPRAARYCKPTATGVSYENAPVERPDAARQAQAARVAGADLASFIRAIGNFDMVNQVEALGRRIRIQLGTGPSQSMGRTGTTDVKPERVKDSSLGQVFTDAMRNIVPAAQVAINNASGLRTSFTAGMVITFEDLFRLMPFNNHLLRGQIKASVLVQALQHAAQTCGLYGTLNFSGIVATYQRDCTNNNSVTPAGRLLTAEVGAVPGKSGNINLLTAGDQPIDTLAPDFHAGGGDSYLMFRDQPWKEIDAEGNILPEGVAGGTVLREALAIFGGKNQINWSHPVDQRWRNLNAAQDVKQ